MFTICICWLYDSAYFWDLVKSYGNGHLFHVLHTGTCTIGEKVYVCGEKGGVILREAFNISDSLQNRYPHPPRPNQREARNDLISKY